MQALRKPNWLKVQAPGGDRYVALKKRMRALQLNTVCEEARCPNIGECWSSGTATVMILGEICTRGCRFCAVKSGQPPLLDREEPGRVAEAIRDMALDYVVITSVDRDDLSDGGSTIFSQTITAVQQQAPNTLIEVLTPDFAGDVDAVNRVVDAGPNVFAHNVETVERLQRTVRDARCSYPQSLAVLAQAKKRFQGRRALTKTSIMLGVGETEPEVIQCMKDLRTIDCDVVTFGQYLRPTPKHLPLSAFIEPEQFDRYRDMALEMGFVYCASGPLVRSSYRAGEYFLRDYLGEEAA